MTDVRNARFFRWYRTVPLVIVLLMLILSLTVDMMPLDLARSLFFPVSYAERIDETSDRYGVDEHLVAAIIRCESGWNERAMSSKGAGRVDTNRFNPNNLADPATNIEYGTALLAFLDEQLETTDEVICAYNAGLGAVQGWISEADSPGIPKAIKYPETAHYLERVQEALRQYTRYYPDGLSSI